MDLSSFRPSENVEDYRNEPWWLKSATSFQQDWDQYKKNLDDLWNHPFERSLSPYKQRVQATPATTDDPLAVSLGYNAVPKAGAPNPNIAVPSAQQAISTSASASTSESPQDAIRRAAKEAGIDPAFALAVAERESKFDPTAHSSKTIYGLYQMRGDLRAQYGAGDSSDPYTQAKAWTAFIGDQKAQMASVLGRAPTNEELYYAHHFGTDRAIRMIAQMPPGTNVADVFSPNERSLNPHFDKAGTTGQLMSDISADLGQRMKRFGTAGDTTAGPDFASFGQGAEGGENAPSGSLTPTSTTASTAPQAPDFASFGRPVLASAQGTSMYNDVPRGTSGASAGGGQAETEPEPEPSQEQEQQPQGPIGLTAAEQSMARAIRARQRPGQEVDLSFLKAPGANLQNPAVSGALPQNPALGMG